jgi:hypothetical protein
MAYAYEIDVERQLVVVVFSADANLAEAEAVMTQIHADPRHSLRLSRVYDCRAVTRLPPLSELRAVAELFRRRVDPTVDARRAIVARGGAPYGLGRMLQALLDLIGLELHVFTRPGRKRSRGQPGQVPSGFRALRRFRRGTAT